MDKQTRQYEVVLEIGTCYTKVGFSLDSQPKKVLKINFQKLSQKSRLAYELDIEEELYSIFNVEMVCSLKGRCIALVYNYYNNEEMYNIIAQILYNKFEVAKISFLLGNVLPLYLSGHFSGVIIDLGYNQSTACCVYEGYSLLHQGGYIGEGGKHSAKRIKNLLPDYSQDSIEDFTIKYSRILDKEEINNQIKIKIKNIEIQEYDIAKCYTDTYFGNYKEEESNIAYGFLKMIATIKDRDVITKMLQNIIITGGGRKIKNLLNRFKLELLEFLEGEFNQLKNLKFYITTLNQQYPSWVGGSLLVQIGGYDKFFVSAQKFRENGNLFCTRSDAYNFISIK